MITPAPWLVMGSGVLFVIAATPVRAEWLVAPVARIATTYSDNPRLSSEPEPQDATGAVGELSAFIERRGEYSSFSVRPRLRSARYDQDDTLDRDDQFLDARFSYTGERTQWNTSVEAVRDTTLTSELGFTGFVETNRRHESLQLSAGPTIQLTEHTRAGMEAVWLDSRYLDAERTGLVDYEYRIGSLQVERAIGPTSQLTLTARAGELLVPASSSRTRDASLRAGWRGQVNPWWTLSASLGPAYVDAASRDDTGWIFDTSAERRGEYWTWSISAGRSLTPTGRGLLTRRDRAVLSFTHPLTQHVVVGSSLQWIRNQDFTPAAAASIYEVDYGRIDTYVSWRWSPSWSLELAWGGATQNYDAAPRRAEDYNASLSIVWNGRKRAL